MLSFEEAGRVLDAAVEALPEGIFDDLNGGVNLLPEERRNEDGRVTLGLYHHDAMGRWVEIFYGSFLQAFPDVSDERFAQELRNTLHHELTHHVESKAGDHSLEHWDAEQTALWEQGEPLRAASVLFVDEDAGLSLRADALLRAEAQERGLHVRSGWAALPDVTRRLLDEYEAVLCMTMAQAEALAERFPAVDAQGKILCLGEKDILPGRLGADRALRREIQFLAEELSMEDEEP